eukprot:3723521-Rhodomonas_salina.1
MTTERQNGAPHGAKAAEKLAAFRIGFNDWSFVARKHANSICKRHLVIYLRGVSPTEAGCGLAVLYLLWACTPDWVLHSISITYYPSRYPPSRLQITTIVRYWAIALPSYALSLLLYLIALYNAWNMVCTNPFESYYTFRGTFASCRLGVRIKLALAKGGGRGGGGRGGGV